MDKLRDQFVRNQEAFRAVTARELDWQKRYHEDTNKLMAQLSQKGQDHERTQAEIQRHKAEAEHARQELQGKEQEVQQHKDEMERALQELRDKDQEFQAHSQRAAQLEQSCAAHEISIQERDQAPGGAGRGVSCACAARADAQKKHCEEQAAIVSAAQDVMAELRPKLQLLENKLTQHP
jgi:hypothetical protein